MKVNLTPLVPQNRTNCFLPAAGFEHRAFNLERRHTKVGNTNTVLVIQKKIFWLQITMAGIVQRNYKLTESTV